MKETNLLDLACRHCRYYQPEGRRGGSCQKLGVSVDSHWKACILASSPFENALDNLDATLSNLEEIVQLENAFSLPYNSHPHDNSNKHISKKPDSFAYNKSQSK